MSDEQKSVFISYRRDNQTGQFPWAGSDYQTYLNLGGGRQYGDQPMVEQWMRNLSGR